MVGDYKGISSAVGPSFLFFWFYTMHLPGFEPWWPSCEWVCVTNKFLKILLSPGVKQRVLADKGRGGVGVLVSRAAGVGRNTILMKQRREIK